MAEAPTPWSAERLPDQTGRTYLITGANAGLGFFAAEALARAGAHVVVSGRNPNRLSAAHDAIAARVPDAHVETLLLDVSNPGSIRAAAASVRGGLFQRQRLDGVLLNAGIIRAPKRRTLTRDRLELVFATNALGHFILASEVLTALSKSASRAWTPRMVWLGSIATHLRRYDVDDLQLERGYSASRAYVQSKIACQLLGFEADRRLRAADLPVRSLVAHPGYAIGARTERVAGVHKPTGRYSPKNLLQRPVTHSKRRGAESLVRALIDPDASGGEFYGPNRFFTGASRIARPTAQSSDVRLQERTWDECERLAGSAWPIAKAQRVAGI